MVGKGEQGRERREASEEDLPEVKVGEVWESTDPREDERRRRVRVEEVPEDGGQVTVSNVETGRTSHIARERFVPGASGYRRFFS